MADDRDKDAPSLEPPSLFGRKKKKAAQPPAPPAPVEPTPAAADEVQEPVEDAVVVAAPVPAPVPEPVAEPVSEPVSEPVAVPVADPVAEPVAETVSEPVADETPTTILDEPASPVPAPAAVAVPAAPASSLTPPPAPAAPKPPREPWVTGRAAAVLAGLLVGAIIVAATAGSLRICTEVKGTSSCGGPGLFLLVAILIVAVLVGAALLRAARVPEPGSTSFLAVGLLSVFALLFLVGQLFAWWMIIVIPVVSVCTFLLSHWVTTTYIDPANDGADPDREPEPHDVR